MNKSNFMLASCLVLAANVTLLGTAVAADSAGAAAAADTVGKAETVPTITGDINVANGEDIFNNGKGDAAACMGCHGDKALGNDDMGAPRLANLGQYYIVKQLTDFAADRRVPSGMGAAMNGFAKALTPQDRIDVAGFLDSLEFTEEPSDLKALAANDIKVGKPELGKPIVEHGIKGKVPACQDCHGFNGRASRFPKINQQKYVYLQNQLHNWKDDSRANDPEVENVGIMRRIAKLLSDDDINNIAAFLSQASRFSPDVPDKQPAATDKK